MSLQIAAALILVLFYSVYIIKMITQKVKGIQTDQIARGKSGSRFFIIELIMKVATYSVIVVEIISITINSSALPWELRFVGLILGVTGDIIFILAVWTMRDSWRAGIAESDETAIVTEGIYKISRNPAFLGFDLVYIGVMIMFFNWILFIFSVFAIVMLHLQILQEEKYLISAFGDEYSAYRKKVGRYIGR